MINLNNHFTDEELKIIEKLGCKIKNKIYTQYELEVLNIELLAYYIYEDMSKEELREVKSLEGTGVSRKQYNKIMQKFEEMNEIYNF